MARSSHAPAATRKLERSCEHVISMLTAMFLLGMAVNLLGLPDETSGAAKVATTVFLTAHGLIAMSLLIEAFLATRAARKVASGLAGTAHAAAAGIGITFVAGVITMATDNGWFSYLMAAGFVVSFLLYGLLLVRAKAVSSAS